MATPAPDFSHMFYTCSGYYSVNSNVSEARTRCVERTIDAILQREAEYRVPGEMEHRAHFRANVITRFVMVRSCCPNPHFRGL